MTLSETYRAERLIDRRSRACKARIAGRVIGFVLMACLIVAIRTDPQLRTMVDDAALAVISGAMPEKQQSEATQTADHLGALEELGLDPHGSAGNLVKSGGVTATGKPSAGHMPESKVKIHRGGIARD